MATWEYTVAEMLSDQGYDTAMYGKWHLGYVDDRLPINQGFDEWWGFPFSTDVSWFPDAVGFDPTLFGTPRLYEGRKGEGVKTLQPYDKKVRPYVDAIIAEKSAAYIKQHANGDKPEIYDAELPFYSAEALELAMGAIKEEAIKKMVKEKLIKAKEAILGD